MTNFVVRRGIEPQTSTKIFFHIFCNAIYTWSLGAHIFFTTFEEEFIYFKILPSPHSPGYLMVAPLLILYALHGIVKTHIVIISMLLQTPNMYSGHWWIMMQIFMLI